MESIYDVIIIGSGIVGASLAIVLAQSSFKIALVEASSHVNQKSENERTIVLAHSSKVIFDAMNVWKDLAAFSCPIHEVHVSDRGRFGTTKILAREENLKSLGYVLSAGQIQKVLHTTLYHFANIDVFQPAKFLIFNYADNRVQVELQKGENIFKIEGKLLVAADGQHSAVRKFQNIKSKRKDYQQTAIICTVELKRPHGFIAYERFTPAGPLAMLPLIDQHSAVVWTMDDNSSKIILTLSNSDFLLRLQRCFGYRLGKFLNCGPRNSISLQLITAEQQIQPGMVLLGNAVHTLHPVAGQGLNLAMRDLAILAEELVLANKNCQTLGNLNTLQRYLNRRLSDQQKTISLTHSLVGVFSNSLLPVVLARNAGLLLIDRLSWLKEILAKRTLGITGEVPRLACGMDLDDVWSRDGS